MLSWLNSFLLLNLLVQRCIGPLLQLLSLLLNITYSNILGQLGDLLCLLGLNCKTLNSYLKFLYDRLILTFLFLKLSKQLIIILDSLDLGLQDILKSLDFLSKLSLLFFIMFKGLREFFHTANHFLFLVLYHLSQILNLSSQNLIVLFFNHQRSFQLILGLAVLFNIFSHLLEGLFHIE